MIKDWQAGSPQEQHFTYDPLNRLTHARVSGGSAGLYEEGYAYNEIGNLQRKGEVAYGYHDPAHVHAVTHLTMLLTEEQKYWYDANGNQTRRVVGTDTYDLAYDAENRLVEVQKNGAVVATFVYGPEGERVQGTVDGVTTRSVGNHYEVEGMTVRKYDYAGEKRIAMRENGVLYWLLTDHLGSTAVVADAEGNKVGEVRYKAFGEDRYTFGTTPTTYRYTGQRQEAALGLYFYNARWYDPFLGRFVQVDTIVPEPGGPQGLNRYAYVRNSPLRFTDPSGHCIPGKDCPEDRKAKTQTETVVQEAESLEGDLAWANPPNNDFYHAFVDPAPLVIEHMNCWEFVMFAAYEAGVIDEDWIRGFYANVETAGTQAATQAAWVQLGAFEASPYDSSTGTERGQLVFFTTAGSSYPGHVALATGGQGGDEIMSLWLLPPSSDPDVRTDSVQRTTISALQSSMETVFGKSVSVTTGAMPWISYTQP